LPLNFDDNNYYLEGLVQLKSKENTRTIYVGSLYCFFQPRNGVGPISMRCTNTELNKTRYKV